MGTYYLPRNTKGEGRILFIFTTKSLITTAVGGAFGFVISLFFSAMKMDFIGFLMILLFALFGFLLGTVKIPEISFLEFTKKTGGENILEIIKRAFIFKRKGKRIYTYKEEDTNDK